MLQNFKITLIHRLHQPPKGTCDRHNSYVKTFDFSEDSVYIQSDSGDYEHLYFEAEDGEYFASGSQLKNIRWSDWTCTFGWPIQGKNSARYTSNLHPTSYTFLLPAQFKPGAWPYFDDVDKGRAFEPTAVHRSADETLLAVGDTSGAVKIFNYPCLAKDVRLLSTLTIHHSINSLFFLNNIRTLGGTNETPCAHQRSV